MQLEFEAGIKKEYKVKGIEDSAIYAKKAVRQLPRLYYLVSWKSYPEKENTWEPALAIQHLWKLVTVYHKNNLEKPIATSAPVNTAPQMARTTTLPMPKSTIDIPIKQKWGRPIGSTTTTKWAKMS